MIEYQGEHYLTVREVAERFRISWGLCYSTILPSVNKCYLPGRKHALYTQSDGEQFAGVRIVEKPCRILPASTCTAETGSGVTSPPNIAKETGIASRANSLSKNNTRKENDDGQF